MKTLVLFFFNFLLLPASCCLLSSLQAQTYTVNGTVNYDNTMHSTMDSCIITIYDMQSVYGIDTTDNDGAYSFESIPPGVYSLQIECHKNWGGGAATDALFMLYQFVGRYHLTGIQLAVADISNDHVVNSLDALYTSLRFVGAINSFPSGDWYFEPLTLQVINAPVIQNIKANCFGDVNGSYIPINSHPGN